jgi:hypothetical protein
MSALPPKAHIHERRLDVRFVPKADIGSAHSIISRLGANSPELAGIRARVKPLVARSSLEQ